MYAFWVRHGYTPDVVDSWPVAWSSGWLLEQAARLDTDPEKWWGEGMLGFGLDDPDYDPALPAWWRQLPRDEGEVLDGE